MKKLIILFFITSFTFCHSQNAQLAYTYFREGEFEKAAKQYKNLYDKNNNNRIYLKNLLKCYQELEKYDKVEEIILTQKKKRKYQYFLDVELGYNYHLQKQDKKADSLYQIAIDNVTKNPGSARLTGQSFQSNFMLEKALETYETAMQLKPQLNYNLYIAKIYGEQLKIDKMFDAYLQMVEKNSSYYSTIQRYVGKFLTDDNENEYNILFKKAVIKRLQNNPKDEWNNLLSWLYMQQKDYGKALIQEKAVYTRGSGDLSRVFNLADVAFKDAYFNTTLDAYNFILKNSNNQLEIILAEERIINIEIAQAKTDEELKKIEKKFDNLFIDYGKSSTTILLQLAYADFLTFNLNKPQEALTVLSQAKQYATSRFNLAEIKIKLADVLVYTDKFNQALIHYTQVQTDVRSSDIAQTARLKVAKTSYYKGDFDWAKTQLKVLKSATSKLISNDALDLNLLIGDNIANDTIRRALGLYAKADLLSFQNKTSQAIDTLSIILKDFKGHAVEDEALFKQAYLYSKKQQYEFAEKNYLKIISLDKKGILMDDALFTLGSLYQYDLLDNERAKEMYQKIIFDYPSSIYLVESRKRFRKLRGDELK